MSYPLSMRMKKILASLGGHGGLVTKDIRRAVLDDSHDKRSASGIVLYELKILRLLGLVEYLDDKKPIVWVRTEKGARAIGSEPSHV